LNFIVITLQISVQKHCIEFAMNLSMYTFIMVYIISISTLLKEDE